MSKYAVGLRNVGSYIVSGQPFITGSQIEANEENRINQGLQKQIDFPFVTKNIQLWNFADNSGAKLRLHFIASGSITGHDASRQFYEIGQNESLSIDIKCKSVWVSTAGGNVLWKMYASLTNIPTGSMYTLSGTGISGP